jgi:hypothetical protein
MTNYLYITDYGDAQVVDFTPGQTLSDLQTLVGGLIECVRVIPAYVGFDADVWVNEEGLCREDFGVNYVASSITGRKLVGPAVIALTDLEGNTAGLTASQIRRLEKDGLLVDRPESGSFTVAEVAAHRFEVQV